MPGGGSVGMTRPGGYTVVAAAWALVVLSEYRWLSFDVIRVLFGCAVDGWGSTT